MGLPVVLMAAGTAMQIAGRYQANFDQATAEMQNAAFYREQAIFAKLSQARQEEIIAQEYTTVRSAQVSRASMGGVDVGSGSIVNALASSYARQISNLEAARQKADMDFKLASMRGFQSQAQADTLGSLGFNLAQGSSTLATNYAQSYGFGSGAGFASTKERT